MVMKVNREFLARHLFAAFLLAGMAAWFGYDGYVRYPSMTPEELYSDAHKGECARDAKAARDFYETAIPRQHQFMWLLLLASCLVGGHLYAVTRRRISFDETGFDWCGKRRFYGEVKSVDRKKWAKKGIVVLTLSDGSRLSLDSWHHVGVAEFMKHVDAASCME